MITSDSFHETFWAEDDSLPINAKAGEDVADHAAHPSVRQATRINTIHAEGRANPGDLEARFFIRFGELFFVPLASSVRRRFTAHAMPLRARSLRGLISRARSMYWILSRGLETVAIINHTSSNLGASFAASTA